MRISTLILTGVLAFTPFLVGAGGVANAASEETSAHRSDARLDELFVQLAAARDPADALLIEEAIWDRWGQSGSAGVDFLMARGLDAMGQQDLERALVFFDQVVELAPGYAEGWNKRAVIHYMREDYRHALNDLNATIALEPRHFGALGGLALMLVDLGDKEGALEAYRRVLKVHPWLPGAQEAEAALTIEVEGRGI